MSEQSQLIEIPQSAPSTGQLIAAVVQSGMTTSSVEVIERLCALKEREEKSAAERAFAAAFAKLQIETPRILAQKAVPDKHGNVKYSYAPYDEIMRQVRPLLAAHGFAITFDTDVVEGRVVVTCTLIHIGGHSRSNKFACRIGSGPPGSSEAQGDGAATTYAKRFALCAALNIVVEQDTDARREDCEAITKEQAADLRLRCEESNTDITKLCAWLHVAGLEHLNAEQYAMADAELRKREARK